MQKLRLETGDRLGKLGVNMVYERGLTDHIVVSNNLMNA